MRRLILAAAAISFISLTACGGGGGNNNPAPQPPAPPPPPPPPAAMNDSLINMTEDEAFDAVSVTMRFNVNTQAKATGVTSSISNLGGGTVTYDVGADSFTLGVNNGGVNLQQTFRPADITDQDAVATVYENTNGERLLIMVNPGQATGLTYSTLANWIDATGNNGDIATGHMVFGVRTAANDMPNTGTGNYTGETAGSLISADGTIYTLYGATGLNVDFGAGTLTGFFNGMTKIDVLTEQETPWRGFSINANLNGNTFSGTAETNDGLLTGTTNGGFFGPNAEEIGGGWRLTGNGEQAVGGFVAY